MFGDLPVELLQCIFMLLSPCSDLLTVLNVCKRWREVGRGVFKLRESLSLSAFKMQSPLQWVSPQLSTCTERTKYIAPSKRFGATVMLKDQLLYVFGGATKELTAFNDLWTYDLCSLSWKRVIGKGELPTPRAHAKGGFIDNLLYLYGGCQSFHRAGSEHTGRMDWLTELNSLDLLTMHWARVPLYGVNRSGPVSPPAIAGQSGCFLPKGGVGEPSVLVLFGGMCQSLGFCVNYLFIVSPESGCWISLSDTIDDFQNDWPSGRCGHSTCALDSNRMLLLFGNLESPLATDHSGRRHQRVPVSHNSNYGSELTTSPPKYHGRPAGDVWILTRCSPNSGQEWFKVNWFWTKVQCSESIPGSPPIDFYHAATIPLPYHEANASHLLADSHFNPIQNDVDRNYSSVQNIYTIVVISQPTTALLDEAAKQRKYWQRIKLHSELNCVNSQNNLVSQDSRISDDDDGNDDDEEQRRHCHPANVKDHESSRILHLPSSTRANNRRARRLEALAFQERRLFGTRNLFSNESNASSIARSISTNQGPSNHRQHLSNPVKFESTYRPLALYSLDIVYSRPDVGFHSETKIHFTLSKAKGVWLTPVKQRYLDLCFAPPECLGFTCTFGHDCLFLFGGLTDSDDMRPNENSDTPLLINASHNHDESDQHQRYDDLYTSPLSRSSVINGSLSHGHLTSRVNPSDANTSTAQFYVLRARALAGTLI
uniref:F-box only protein 42 n=1 Tax=Schistosoma japonicum TaxID=6182 RepID=C1LEJ5_SCHJA|nr:F-box only protein 42 [Schistosoma japonicum]